MSRTHTPTCSMVALTTAAASRQHAQHHMIRLWIRTDDEDLCAHLFEPAFPVKRLRPYIALPHAEPQLATTACPRAVLDGAHQCLRDTATLPRFVDVEPPELDGPDRRYARWRMPLPHHRKSREPAVRDG